MECRAGCGACCISSPIPGMPDGKPAGVRCIHLNAEFLCAIFGRPERPAVCAGFKAEEQLCAADRESAIRLLGWLEQATA